MFEDFVKKPEDSVFYITIWGSFSPTTFQYWWFVKNNLLGEKEAKNAEIKSTKNGIYVGLKYCKLQAKYDVLAIQTDQIAYLDEVFDLLNGILISLKNVPIKAVEYSMYIHHIISDDVENVLKKIAPNNFWTGILDNPISNEIKVIQTKKEKIENQVSVSIEPCPKSKEKIHIQVDDYYNFTEKKIDAKELQKKMRGEFEKSINNSITIINKATNEF